MVTDTLRVFGNMPELDKTRIIAAIEQVLHYDAKGYEVERREPWEELRQQFVADDFPSRMRRWVGMDLLEDKFDDTGQHTDKAQRQVEALAEEAVQKLDLLRPELPWLTTSAAQNGLNFGYALGAIDKDSVLLPKLLDAQRRAGPDGSAFFLSGYFQALRRHDEALWEGELERGATDSVLRRYVPELTWRSGLTDRAAKRILFLAREGHISADAFRMFSYGGVVGDLLPERLEEWIDFLLMSDSQAAAVCGLELSYFYQRVREPSVRLRGEMIYRVLTAAPLFTPSENRQDAIREDYEWVELASAFVEEYPGRSVELGKVMLKHFREGGTIVGAFHSQTDRVLERILERFPAELWECIAGHLGPPIDSRAFHIYHWLNGGALALIPPDLVWNWVDEDVEGRAWYVANFVPKTFPGNPGRVSARAVLVRYGSRPDVRGNLMANFSSEMWHGPESSHAQRKLEQLNSWRRDETEANVRVWLDEYIRAVEERIEQAKVEEERRD